ncbi:DegT/DnrJ/EryC1/StrS aminotransferase family protein [Paractinoplanes brasiliensis]|uniref:dTDP-4-amino-4,6-dideoxygalactose transaminase n=1 Tax=Paractinoplanes brasiliensis TaxID=52695 RepID=A0A4R6JXV9_9ACTN|nr:DegT/DnrJ/EryC1/StrS aminotransferase family protein [Actinoplanes brasiliensis]TDO41673.1 hypothetical protein C8E87_5410 [Actinoplanes brasiliensis]GID27040.1 hypothetical protein Abr02nite_20230 [Actinoplanes brasiliensis]
MRPEIGSEFHWDPAVLLNDARDGLLPPGHALFATGCGALTVLLRHLARPGRLHVPSFFCMGVAQVLGAHMPLAWYRDLPSPVRPGDVVLAQNLFGRSDGAVWREWIPAHPEVTVIEDHSHDPFGPWAANSIAAYGVASLRKTLPLPDGGMLWSPQGHDVPTPVAGPAPGSDLKLAAMVLKAAWLDGRPVAKAAFRDLQQQGERALLGSESAPSAFTTAVLPVLDIAGLRATATRNVRALEDLLPAPPGTFPPGAAPFRIQVLCPDEPTRDGLLRHLAAHGIYAPVHWRQPTNGFWSGDPEAADLATRILTLPVDHRCTPGDIDRIAAVVASAPMPVSAAPGVPARRSR